MRQRRNALLGALVWWFGRRWLRKRASKTVGALPGLGSAGGGSGRTRAIGGALGLVAVLAVGLVAWRKLLRRRAPEAAPPAREQAPKQPPPPSSTPNTPTETQPTAAT